MWAPPSSPNFLPKGPASKYYLTIDYIWAYEFGGGGHKRSVHYKYEQCTVDVVFDPGISFRWPVLLKAFLVLCHLSKMRNTYILYPRKCWTIWNTWFSFIPENWPVHFLTHIFHVSLSVQLWHASNIAF